MAKKKEYGSPYRMKGSPMKRNFGIGASPLKQPVAAAMGAAAVGSLVSAGLGKLFGSNPPVEVSNPAEGLSKMQFGNKRVE